MPIKVSSRAQRVGVLVAVRHEGLKLCSASVAVRMGGRWTGAGLTGARETIGVAQACLPRGVPLELGDVAHRQFLTMRYATNISSSHRKRAFGAQLMRGMRGGFHHQGDESTRKCLGKSYER